MENSENPKASWIIVYITHNIAEAHIVAGRLQHEGIVCVIDYSAGMRAMGITIGAWGEVRVLVHPQDYEDALAILEPEVSIELEESVDAVKYLLQDDDDPE